MLLLIIAAGVAAAAEGTSCVLREVTTNLAARPAASLKHSSRESSCSREKEERSEIRDLYSILLLVCVCGVVD